MTGSERVERARAYYEAIDGGDYDRLASLLAEGFVHDRPDRTIEGRERFVRFMREERPQPDTSHPLDGLYCPDRDSAADEVVVRGRLLDGDGERIVGFVDVFSFDGDDVEHIETYTR